MSDLIKIIPRKDMVFHEIYAKFKEDSSLVIREAFLYIVEKYIKYDIKIGQVLFAKALIEKIFDNSTVFDEKD